MPAVPDLPQAEIAVVELTNELRRANDLPAVAPNAALAAAARAFAQYLARTGEFAHGADGRQPAGRAAAAGYRACQVAENLALNVDGAGFATRALARQVTDGWKNSPGHRRNLLAPHVTEVGVGIAGAPGQEHKYISVQLLARPEALAYSFRIANRSGRSVRYSFLEQQHEIAPRYVVTHTACVPGTVRFEGTAADGAFAARPRAVYTLRAAAGGGLAVEVAEQAAR